MLPVAAVIGWAGCDRGADGGLERPTVSAVATDPPTTITAPATSLVRRTRARASRRRRVRRQSCSDPGTTGARPPDAACHEIAGGRHRRRAASGVELGRGGRCFDVARPQCAAAPPTGAATAPGSCRASRWSRPGRAAPWAGAASGARCRARCGPRPGAGSMTRRDGAGFLAMVPRRDEVDRSDSCRRSATCPRVSSALLVMLDRMALVGHAVPRHPGHDRHDEGDDTEYRDRRHRPPFNRTNGVWVPWGAATAGRRARRAWPRLRRGPSGTRGTTCSRPTGAHPGALRRPGRWSRDPAPTPPRCGVSTGAWRERRSRREAGAGGRAGPGRRRPPGPGASALSFSIASARSWNSGMTSRAKSSSDSQMSSWRFRPAWLTKINWSTPASSYGAHERPDLAGVPTAPRSDPRPCSMSWAPSMLAGLRRHGAAEAEALAVLLELLPHVGDARLVRAEHVVVRRASTRRSGCRRARGRWRSTRPRDT